MSDVSFELRGTRAMATKIAREGNRVGRELPRALRAEAEAIVTTAKQTTVPVAPDGGTLRASGFVDEPTKRGREIEVRIGFGGPSAPYAVAIHEHESEHSPPTWRGVVLKFHLGGEVGVKYLERPFNAALVGMAGRIARELEL